MTLTAYFFFTLPDAIVSDELPYTHVSGTGLKVTTVYDFTFDRSIVIVIEVGLEVSMRDPNDGTLYLREIYSLAFIFVKT